jgi:hypothetical protein
MRIGFTVACISLLWSVATCSADERPDTGGKPEPVRPDVKAILREAGEIILKQPEHQNYWTQHALLRLGDVQIRAGDFDGALRSIRACGYPYGRDRGLDRLAEALARHGNMERASDIVRLMDFYDGWRRDDLDRVQLCWVDHLIDSGDLRRARKAIDLVKSHEYRADGLRKLAVAYGKSSDAVQATELFARALDAAAGLKDELGRVRALSEIADAQLSVGQADAAKETIRRLAETVEWKAPQAKVSALREAAVLTAKAKDEPTSHRLFRQAIKALDAIDKRSKIGELHRLAMAQAGVGHIDDALKTAAMIEHSVSDFAQDAPREEALVAIAVAQLKANDPDGAVRSALAVKYFLQYRDDAIHKVVDYQIARRDLKAALTEVDHIHNASRKAAAILKVAIAHARSRDRRAAAAVAAGIELTQRDREQLPEILGKNAFHYRLPHSWGVCYDSGLAFTLGSHRMAVERAADVAEKAMKLYQVLGERPGKSYAILFNEIRWEEVIQALARAHAASGDPSEALAWAEQIGSNGKIKSEEDRDTLWAVEQRIFALIGLAEGILDRSGAAPPEPAP